MIKIILLIGSGGFIGSVSRFFASRYIQNYFLSSFPFGTFIVNITGCFLIGVFFGISEKSNFFNSDLKLFFTTGFCGGFTTFSTFTSENVMLLKDGSMLYFFMYTGLSVFIGLLATYAGNLITKTF